jgi:hypothetical protein
MKNRRSTWFLVVIVALTTDALSADLEKSEPLVIDGKTELTIRGPEISNPRGNGITTWNSKRIRIEGRKIGHRKGEAVNIFQRVGRVGLVPLHIPGWSVDRLDVLTSQAQPGSRTHQETGAGDLHAIPRTCYPKCNSADL